MPSFQILFKIATDRNFSGILSDFRLLFFLKDLMLWQSFYILRSAFNHSSFSLEISTGCESACYLCFWKINEYWDVADAEAKNLAKWFAISERCLIILSWCRISETVGKNVLPLRYLIFHYSCAAVDELSMMSRNFC